MPLYATLLQLVAALTAWLTAPVCIRIALRLGVVDKPDVRKEHRRPTPYLGGVAVLVGMAAAIATLFATTRDPEASWARLDDRLLTLLAGAGVIFAIGLADDFRPLRARYKMFAQLAVALWMWRAGVRFESLPLFDGTTFELSCAYISLPVTVLWIVGITNALNLIDGLDGLASGIGAIAAAAISFVAFETGHAPTACVLAALSAALIGFLCYNHHPAKIFLGDAGSLMIGFLLATCSITTASESTSFVAIGAPVLALAVPILDLSFTVLRRLIERRGIFSPDHNHVHFRLLALGYSHGRTVTILWCESAVLTVVALSLFFADVRPAQQLITFATVTAAHLLFFRFAGAVRIRESLGAFHRAARRMRDARSDRRECDSLDLLFRRARSLNDWWEAIETTAERLEFAAIRLDLPRRTGGVSSKQWRHPHGVASALETSLEVPDRREDQTLRVQLSVAGESLEAAAGRVTLFGKLLDRYPAKLIPSVAPQAEAPASTELAEPA